MGSSALSPSARARKRSSMVYIARSSTSVAEVADDALLPGVKTSLEGVEDGVTGRGVASDAMMVVVIQMDG